MAEKITKTPEAIEAEREQIEKMRGEIKALCNKVPPAVLSGSSLRQLSDSSRVEESRVRRVQACLLEIADANQTRRCAHRNAGGGQPEACRMKVAQLMDELRRLDPDMPIAVRTHTDFREVKFVERSDGNIALIDIRFSAQVDDEPEDD